MNSDGVCTVKEYDSTGECLIQLCEITKDNHLEEKEPVIIANKEWLLVYSLLCILKKFNIFWNDQMPTGEELGKFLNNLPPASKIHFFCLIDLQLSSPVPLFIKMQVFRGGGE